MRALAVAQTTPVVGDVDANVAQHLELADVAAEAGGRQIVFPELSLTGYEIDRAAALAFALDDARLEPLRAFAAKREVTLVVGAPVLRDGQLFIGSFIIGPAEVALYTKQHLGAFGEEAAVDAVNGGEVPPAEASVFAPGSDDPLLAIGEHRAAFAICADVGQPSHAEKAAARGADTYLASMFVIPSDYERETERLAEAAKAHGIYVVFANHGGPTGGLAAAGGSAIITPEPERLVWLRGLGAGVAIARETARGWLVDALMLSRGLG